jgi:hypothetical protein
MTTPCWDREEGCLCILPKGHETPHVCECGGSYSKGPEGFQAYAMPPGTGPGTYTCLTEEQAIEKANEMVRQGPLDTGSLVAAFLGFDDDDADDD